MKNGAATALQEALPEDKTVWDVLCLYGFDTDSAASLIPRLEQEDKYLILFAQEEDLLSPYCGERIKILVLEEGYFPSDSFEALCWEFVFLQFSYLAHPQADLAKVEALWSQCRRIQGKVHLLASDYQDFGSVILKNVQKNLERVSKYLEWGSIKNSLQGLPAIICGAGPSLNDAIQTLKQASDKAVVFGGGAALCALSRAGIPVHMAAGIDPDPGAARFLEHAVFEAPFFYQDRFSERILSLTQGPLFQVPSNGGYELEQWLREELHLETEPFDGGWTVATFCTALAVYLGCSPVILAGMDFAHRPGSSGYAQGVREDREAEWIEVQDPKAGLLRTKRDWVQAADWIAAYADAHPEICFYNISSGLRLGNIPSCSFNELLHDILTNRYDVQGRVHQCLQGASYKKIEKEKKDRLFSMWRESLAKAESICNDLLGLFEVHYPNDPREKGEFVMNLYDLYDEIAYQKLLEPLWKIWKFPIERKARDSYEGDIHQLLFFKKIIQSHL
jgi:hypothetical protein